MTFLFSGDLGVLEFVRQKGVADLWAGVNVYMEMQYGHKLRDVSTYEDLSVEAEGGVSCAAGCCHDHCSRLG